MSDLTSTVQQLLIPTLLARAKITPSKRPISGASPLSSGALCAPYWESSAALPKDSNGFGMQMLLQVNFKELPANVDPDFPREGILQLFLSLDPKTNLGIRWGASDQLGQGHGHLIHYWPQPSLARFDPNASAMLMAQPEEHPENFPGATPFLFDFTRDLQPLTPCDLAAGQKRFPQLYDRLQEDDALLSAWNDLISDGGCHQVGGYAYFTQDDPRPAEQDWVLLCQIDTDDSVNLMWGDCGVGNISIPRKALRARDFSQAFFTWDCC